MLLWLTTMCSGLLLIKGDGGYPPPPKKKEKNVKEGLGKKLYQSTHYFCPRVNTMYITKHRQVCFKHIGRGRYRIDYL